jgi:murein DD-endopeptidase MepM/ murein hydrolase activator NlpD
VSRRGGILDLLLVALVAGAAWLRTPVGGLFDRAVAWALDRDADLPALTSYFVTGPPPEIVVLAERIAELPDGVLPAPEGGFPEPWRTAARLVLDDDLPDAGDAIAATVAGLPGEDRAVALLDHLYEGDPEATLEIVAVGAEQRERAIGRARAAGTPDPERFESHRAWLPDREAHVADRVVAGTAALATALDLAWPIAVPHRVSSPYGWRIHPTLGTKKFHDGVDLSVPIGTPVLSAQKGRVARAGEDRVSGKFVVIDHGNGVRTSYCHLDSLGAERGVEIDRSAEIGASGNTGRSTGPHLHFAVRIGRHHVDPERLRPVSDRSSSSGRTGS